MTSWILVISKTFPDHWDFARADMFWDTRRNPHISTGDDVFFWMAETGLISWTTATSDSFQLSPTDAPAHWHDVHDGRYQFRFNLEVVSEDLRKQVSWKEMAQAAGITALPSNGRIEIKDPAGRAYLRSLFTPSASVDIAFSEGAATYQPGDDLRQRARQTIAVRRGQGQFRDALIYAYDGACAVTGSRVLAVLEAAHIDRYYGDHSQHTANGLLLRADIHTLFDLQRIAVDDSLRIRIAPALVGTEYAAYDGTALRLPADPQWRPDRGALRRHRESCDWTSESVQR